MSKVGLLIEDLDKKAKERNEIRFEKKENKKHKYEEAEKSDGYLIRKYYAYLQAVIMELENTARKDFFWKDNEFNNEKRKAKEIDTVYISEEELAKLFIEKVKKANIYEICPFLYKKAVKMLLKQNYLNSPFEDFSPRTFFMEKIKMEDKVLYRVIF